MKTRPSVLSLVQLFLVSVSVPVDAQQPTGSIKGIVRDTSGAVIPGAVISLTREATGIALRQTTSEAGTYTFGSFLPATYQIKMEASGFKTAILDRPVEVGSFALGIPRAWQIALRVSF